MFFYRNKQKNFGKMAAVEPRRQLSVDRIQGEGVKKMAREVRSKRDKPLLALFILMSGLMFVACDDAGLRPSQTDMEGIVLQGYLYRGQPIADIRLTTMIPFGTEDTVITTVEVDDETGDTLEVFQDTVKMVYPINEAKVTITVDGKTITLKSTGDSGWYADESASLTVKEGKKYSIKVVYNGKTLKAVTTVPDKPSGLKISGDTLYRVQNRTRPRRGDTTQPQEPVVSDDKPTSLKVEWNNKDEAPHYIVSEMIQQDTTNTNNNRGNGGRPRGSFTNADSIIVASLRQGGQQRGRVTQIQSGRAGKYVLKVYSVDAVYREIEQSIRNSINLQENGDLMEPMTNIKNGLGIFAAFNYDSVMYDVYQEPRTNNPTTQPTN